MIQVPIWVSNRHIHLSKSDAEKLFWEWYELTKIKDLSQPWQYAAEECITLKWPKGEISKVRILWPYRSQTQVEILMADQFKLWTMAPIRLSWDLKWSAPIEIIAPNWNQISIEEWMIIAKRHIHMLPSDAEHFWVQNNQIVKIKCWWERWLTFDEVVVRITDTSKLDTHIDTEEWNAAWLKTWDVAEIITDWEIKFYNNN